MDARAAIGAPVQVQVAPVERQGVAVAAVGAGARCCKRFRRKEKDALQDAREDAFQTTTTRGSWTGWCGSDGT
jgi:hypothetical protein